MKIRITVLFLIAGLLFYSCNRQGSGTKDIIRTVYERFSESFGSVHIYSSDAAAGDEGWYDEGLVIAMLSEGKSMPEEMSECAEFSFLCTDGMAVCEVWAIECHTYAGARRVEGVFSARKKLLSSLEYENEGDAEAAGAATVCRSGRHVFFAACKNGGEVINYMISLI